MDSLKRAFRWNLKLMLGILIITIRIYQQLPGKCSERDNKWIGNRKLLETFFCEISSVYLNPKDELSLNMNMKSGGSLKRRAEAHERNAEEEAARGSWEEEKRQKKSEAISDALTKAHPREGAKKSKSQRFWGRSPSLRKGWEKWRKRTNTLVKQCRLRPVMSMLFLILEVLATGSTK